MLSQHCSACSLWRCLLIYVKWELTVLLSAEALLAFGPGCEVRVADGLVDIELFLFGGWHSLGRRARQWGAFTLLYQAGKTEHSGSVQWVWVDISFRRISSFQSQNLIELLEFRGNQVSLLVPQAALFKPFQLLRCEGKSKVYPVTGPVHRSRINTYNWLFTYLLCYSLSCTTPGTGAQ